MQMKVVYLVKLQYVHEVDAHQPVLFDLDRVVHVVVRYAIYGVKVVFSVKVGVVAVHHHHHFVSLRPWSLGVDYVDAVQAVRYVLLKWHHVAVVKVQADRLGVKLVGELTAWAYDLKYTIHFGAMDTVKVHRVLLGAIVYEMDPDSVTLGSPDGRPGNAPIKSPCIVIDARRQLHCLPVICNYGIFAQGSSVVKDRGAAIAKVAQVFYRVYLCGACPAVSAYRVKHVACRPISAKPVPAADDDLLFIPGVNAKRENSQGAAYKGDCY